MTMNRPSHVYTNKHLDTLWGMVVQLQDHVDRVCTHKGAVHASTPELPPMEGYPNLQQYPYLSGLKLDDESAQQKSRVHFSEGDPNLQFQDELDAYTAYKGKGMFTPNPQGTTAPQSYPAAPQSYPAAQQTYPEPQSYPEHQSDQQKLEELYQYQSIPVQSAPRPQPQPHALGQDGQEQETNPVLIKLSELVDKYWNGAKSLLKNQRFKTQVHALLRDSPQSTSSLPLSSDTVSLQREVGRLKEELNRVRGENDRLREKAMSDSVPLGDLEHTDESKLKSSLIRAQRDVGILRNRLQKSIEENKVLENKMSGLESQAKSPGFPDMQDLKQIEAHRDENERLRQEIQAMGIRAKQSTQMQELASMLQDSHKSLVQTNEHLLRDLDEARKRHQQEMRQMQWNFDQLRRSGMPPTAKMNGSS